MLQIQPLSCRVQQLLRPSQLIARVMKTKPTASGTARQRRRDCQCVCVHIHNNKQYRTTRTDARTTSLMRHPNTGNDMARTTACKSLAISLQCSHGLGLGRRSKAAMQASTALRPCGSKLPRMQASLNSMNCWYFDPGCCHPCNSMRQDVAGCVMRTLL
jgi:hypothetical protein